MPSASASRLIRAPAGELWELIGDPHHLPRWWPRVERVEDVHDGAFTEVMKTKKGKVVRADFRLLDAEAEAGAGADGDADARTLRWEQVVQGTPFEQVLRSSLTEVRLAPARASASAPGRETTVTISLDQELARWRSGAPMLGLAPRLGALMVRRAAAATIEQALDGLARIGG